MKGFSILKMTRLLLIILAAVCFICLSQIAHNHNLVHAQNSDFLFAKKYQVDEILKDNTRTEDFLREYLLGESDFFALTRNPDTGLTYDGFDLDPQTGQPLKTRYWSAPSKECLDIAICLKALEGNPPACLTVGRGDAKEAREKALDILEKKIESYFRFYNENPGYGGYMPWFYSTAKIEPADDWQGEIPGLDNGEWVWSMLTAEHVLERTENRELAEKYKKYNRILKKNAVPIFYDKEAGRVRGDVRITDTSSPDTGYETITDKPGRCTYLTGEHGVHEGIMMVLYVTLFGADLPADAEDRIWNDINMVRVDSTYGTTWQAYWGSAHESWAFLFLPFRDLPEYSQLFRVREIIRTNNAVSRGYPGLATSTNDPAEGGYLDGAGIEQIGSQKIRNNHTYAVYGTFPMLLEFSSDSGKSGNYGAAWLLNMLKAPKMQGPMGGGESGTNDGGMVSYAKTIDGTFPNILAICGGIEKETADMLKEKGRYEEFVNIMKRKYNEAFGDKPFQDTFSFLPPANEIPVKINEFTAGQKTGEVNEIAISGEEYLKNFEYGKLNYIFDGYYKNGLSLDGRWQVTAYYDGEGNRIDRPKKGFETINIPGHWINQGYFDTTGMELETRFKAGPREEGKREILHFAGAIYYTEVTLNGAPLKTVKGEETHEGYFMPFEYDITSNLRYNEENILKVTVMNPNEVPDDDLDTSNGGTGFPHWGANKRDILGVLDFHDTKPGGGINQKYNVGGIWLPVRIFKADENARISGIPMVNTNLIPKAELKEEDFVRRSAQMNFNIPVENLSGTDRSGELIIEISPDNFPGQKNDTLVFERKISIKPGADNYQIAGVIPHARLWWPWNAGYPSLYKAHIKIRMEGKTLCQRELRFGVREMQGKIRGNWILNGRLLRTLGDNVIPSMTPGTYTKDDALRDGKIIIDANVQLARVHAHMPHPYFLEMADQMGIMIWQDFPQQWLSRWDEEYRDAVFNQLIPFVRIAVSHPSVVLINIHNENKYFDDKNAYGLPKPSRGTWMHASRPAEELNHESKSLIKQYLARQLSLIDSVIPVAGVFISTETGAEYHPYFGYYYGEGLFDFYFTPNPDRRGIFPEYDPFDPAWGWREDGHRDQGVGAVPSTSYERTAGGGGFNRFGPDEFGFQGFSPYAVELAVKHVLSEEEPDLTEDELRSRVKNAIEEIPWGYLYEPDKLPAESERNSSEKLYVKVLDKLTEHSLQAYTIPLWLKPEKPLNEITLEDIVEQHQSYQAWGVQVTAEIFRRAGFGQTRFMLFSSEDDDNLFYSLDWAVLESNRKPKKAYTALQRAYQPILASSEILSGKNIPGQPWMNGLWINNDTWKDFRNCTITVSLADENLKMVKEYEIREMNLLPFSIKNISHLLPRDIAVTGLDFKPGPYTLALRVRDAHGSNLSENIYNIEYMPVDLLKGLDEETKSKVTPILEIQYECLDDYFKNSLETNIKSNDNWISVVAKLEGAWLENWNEWKTEIEKNPEILFDYPEFTSRISPLIDARIQKEKTETEMETVLKNRPDNKKAVEIAKENLSKAKSKYNNLLKDTSKNLKLNDKDMAILMGQRGARIPIPIFYGVEITNDQWFEELIHEMNQCGANKTVDALRKYMNTRDGHWFDRQLKIYLALKACLNR